MKSCAATRRFIRISMLAWMLLVMVPCPVLGPPPPAVDLDEDGLDDAVERALLDRHAPYLHFDSRENNWPSSVTWFIQRSQLVYLDDTVVSQAELAADPSLILKQNCQGVASSTVDGYTGRKTFYRIDPTGDHKGGEGPVPVGTYGHVTPCGDAEPGAGGCRLGDSTEWVVQYWQFFPFNDSQFGGEIGDHEGDWVYLDVYVDRETPHPVKRMVYHHHGDSNCPPTILPRDAPLPDDGIPRCYLEEGAHEWWPWSSDDGGECDWFGPEIHNEGHNGRGPGYRASGIPNLRERFAPMPGLENELILFFNGSWGKWAAGYGDPAASPIHQYFPDPPLAVAYVDEKAPRWSGKGLGSRYYPFRSWFAAAEAVAPGGRFRIAGGDYGSCYPSCTLDKPMTWEGWKGGAAVIGK